MSYGANLRDALSSGFSACTGRILEGAKPADLPVVQSSKFELVINQTDCKDSRPPPCRRRCWPPADEVIEIVCILLLHLLTARFWQQ